MKIFGKHNTEAKDSNLKHHVAKICIDRANGSLCINKKLMNLLSIGKNESAMVIFVQDDKGTLGICKTEDTTIGIPIYWYKTDTRARIFNTTMVYLIMKQYGFKDTSNSYHIVFNKEAVKVGNHMVFQVKECFPYKRQKFYIN